MPCIKRKLDHIKVSDFFNHGRYFQIQWVPVDFPKSKLRSLKLPYVHHLSRTIMMPCLSSSQVQQHPGNGSLLMQETAGSSTSMWWRPVETASRASFRAPYVGGAFYHSAKSLLWWDGELAWNSWHAICDALCIQLTTLLCKWFWDEFNTPHKDIM